ncbi:flagellar hook protein [Chromatium weissei]|nr:flagellar hook protein [Chromatium weissei]
MDTNIVSSLGAGSGIDIKSLVTQLTAVERAPQQARIDAKQKTLEAQISGYGKLKGALDAMKTAVASLGSSDLFNARSVSVSTSDAITADKVSPGAQIGNYKINVSQVASAQSIATKEQDERDSALNMSGNMTISFGAWAYDGSDNPLTFITNTNRDALSINVTAADSLDTIAEKINSQNAGVQASVLKVDDKYQLTLTAPSGASNAMQISVDDASLDDFSFTSSNYSNVSETQQASDAVLKVNGLEVTRESNTIDDVVSGLTFTVNKTMLATDSVTFGVTADKGSAETAVRGFVTAYNSFQETTNKLVGYSRDADNNLVRGDLASDSSARSSINQMRALIGGAVPGLESGFTALTNVGIRTERDGSLSISEDDFTAAFNNNFDLIGSLFASKMTSTNSAVTVNKGTFSSSAVAGTYNVNVTRDPTQGKTFGDAITNGNFDAITTHELTAPLTIAAGGGYNFKINVDGVNSNSIELTGTYNSIEELRVGLQSKINSDSALKANGVGIDVGFDNATDSFNFTSRDYGSVSKAVFTETGSGMTSLGITPTQAKVVGSAITQSTFDSGSGTFTPSLDATTKDYTFKINVDGLESSSITLTNTYTNGADVAAELEAKINADSTLSTAGAAVDVEYDTANNRFSFNSRAGGSVSEIGFTSTSDDMAELGISTTMGGTRGIDVAGTINGVAGFGAGNVLLPDIESEAYGLNFKVRTGATAQSTNGFSASFSRGMAGELSNLIDNFLSSTGVIKSRESSIQTQLTRLNEDKTKLDTRMTAVSARLLAQFTTMERIVSSLQDTGSQMSELVNQLPFTASNNN